MQEEEFYNFTVYKQIQKIQDTRAVFFQIIGKYSFWYGGK